MVPVEVIVQNSSAVLMMGLLCMNLKNRHGKTVVILACMW
jgi:hypothetical protein